MRKMRTYSGAVIHRRSTHGWKEVLQLGPRRGRELEEDGFLKRNLRVDLSNWALDQELLSASTAFLRATLTPGWL